MTTQELMRILVDQGHKNVHNFTIGTLSTYFHLLENRTTFQWIAGVLVLSNLPGSARQKAFCYSKLSSTALLRDLQTRMVVYSIDKIPLTKEHKFVELAYDLDKVFDPKSYEDSRKRHKTLKHPGHWLAKNEITIRRLERSDLLEVKRLHDDWVAYKLVDPATFKMMFPRSRYLRCVSIGFNDSYANYGAFYKDKLVAVRTLYIEDENAFDLAFFGCTWNDEIKSQLMENVAFTIMQDLYSLGVKTINCGVLMQRSLHNFKARWPNYPVTSYMYSKTLA